MRINQEVGAYASNAKYVRAVDELLYFDCLAVSIIVY